MVSASGFATRFLGRSRGWVWAGVVLAASGCLIEYPNEDPPSLTEAPSVAEGDVLVFERQLRWWSAPTSQRARLFARAAGGYLLLREGWQGVEVYGWAEGELTLAGAVRLSEAEAAVDLDATKPAPGDWDCTYVETLPATVYVEGEGIEYLSLCPPVGLAELAGLYEHMVEVLLDCPLDPSWIEGELVLAQTDCAVVE
jgi:hypothetical protein